MENLQPLLDQAVSQLGLSQLKLLRQGNYYSKDLVRSLVYSCQYQGKPATLKVYDDPRGNDEAAAMTAFNKLNTSEIIHASKLIESNQISSQKGWLLIEPMPSNAKPFNKTMDLDERQELLKVFLEYRLNFPEKSPLPLKLAEHLNSANFHLFRINRWLELATHKDTDHLIQTGQHLTDPVFLTQKLQYSLNLLREVFIDRPMIWSHGIFNHDKIFKVSDQEYWLLDFGHTKLFPQGYELGLMIWADYIMSNNWQDSTTQGWLEGIEKWHRDTLTIAKKLKYPAPEKLLWGCLLERAWGTILADILSSSEKSLEEKQARLKLTYALVELCIEKLS